MNVGHNGAVSAVQPRHAARESLAVRIAVPFGVLFTALASLSTILGGIEIEPAAAQQPPTPAAVLRLPAVDVLGAEAVDPCADEVVIAALAADDDDAAVRAFGGGAEFRAAVAAGSAPCVSLDDPNRIWVVVNKQRPLQPEGFAPASLTGTELPTTSLADELRPEATVALERMAAASAAESAGTLGINNGYRSYDVQTRTYESHVIARGQPGADAISARPGYSEHQSGLAFDLIACAVECGMHEEFGETVQGEWVAANAWRFGFIVRYVQGETGTTGYLPEPWHIRYIGPELAAAYHHGGFRTLEEFFGLPAAPDYAH
ncbi:M15 family metallopeptidase [Microbacterium esteraromaticum]|nr:M15 family metallopeptidase [Microbacterium esteraromaticum]